ncbi:unnamed protein product [Bursaphelenchus okinawaensis]|uniref:PBPb domain-containing protein n=1 Tax=Bursaphelenchus okinawaensis TaxID=465554 RepID=A0A811L4H3_9BILA|nr:unnamed protein product [Bursaphelenchus okinawaensis]CAG9119510.1 unnamed protein product [Bursaphelenchus okinawaensis]
MQHNRTLVVYYPNSFPAVNPECSNHRVTRRCPWPGLFVEYIQLFSNHAKYKTIEYTNPAVDYNVNEKGDWTEIYEMLRNGTIDTLAYGLMRTNARLVDYDFSDVLYNSPIYAVHRKSYGDSETTFAFFTIYGFDVVMALLGIIFLQIVFYWLHSVLIECYKDVTYNTVVDSVWSAFSLQLGQALKTKRITRAVNFNRLMFSFINTPILMGLYSTWIVSNRLTATEDGAISTYDDLIDALASNRKYLIQYTGSADWFFEELETSHVYPFYFIRKTLYNNPIHRVSIDEGFNHLNNGDGVALLPDDSQVFQKVVGLCNLQKLNGAIEGIDRRFMVRKNRADRLLIDMNNFIAHHVPSLALIYNKYKSQLIKRRGKCDQKLPNTERPYRGLMYVWLALCVISTCVFVVEMILKLRGKTLHLLPSKREYFERRSRLVFGYLGRAYK